MRALIFILGISFLPFTSLAQLERKTVEESQEVELTFDAPRLITLYTVESLPKKELHVSIMHNFGNLSGGARNAFGLDNGANVRIGFEYGISDRFSMAVGRSGLDKIVDLGMRLAVFKQTTDDKMPVSVSFVTVFGMTTREYRNIAFPGYTFGDRLSNAHYILIARKFSDKFSFQLAPMFANFNRIGPELTVDGTKQPYFSVASGAKLKLTKRTSLTAQYVPSFHEPVRSNVAMGFDIETGGHVFQIFFSNSQAFYEPYLLAGQNGDIGKQEFRLGFNVNRVFATGTGKNRK
jgi:hypothetical protein